MKTLTVAEAVRNFDAVLVALESEGEEILLVRDNHTVARLVPEPKGEDATEFFSALDSPLDAETAEDLLRGIREGKAKSNMTVDQLRNPWDS